MHLPYEDANAGAAIAVQSFGDLKNFNSHQDVIHTDGCFFLATVRSRLARTLIQKI